MSASQTETLRTFLAVEPSEEARRDAFSVSAALRKAPRGDGVRWVRPEAMHVTLQFLGDIDGSEVAPLAMHVASEVAGVPAFEASLGALDAFPNARRARVVVLGLEPAEPFGALAEAVGRGIEAAGSPGEPREARAFRAHLTLGRVRRGSRAPRLDDAPAAPPTRFPVHEVVLFRSQLDREGARYHALERMPLGAGDHPTNNGSH